MTDVFEGLETRLRVCLEYQGARSQIECRNSTRYSRSVAAGTAVYGRGA